MELQNPARSASTSSAPSPRPPYAPVGRPSPALATNASHCPHPDADDQEVVLRQRCELKTVGCLDPRQAANLFDRLVETRGFLVTFCGTGFALQIPKTSQTGLDAAFGFDKSGDTVGYPFEGSPHDLYKIFDAAALSQLQHMAYLLAFFRSAVTTSLAITV